VFVVADPFQATPGGGTAFLVASEQGNIRMLSLLISYGADPMCRDAEDRSGLEIVRHNYPGRCATHGCLCCV